jgi:hypothetical protein
VATEELLFAEAELGLEFGVFFLEESFALEGALMHGLPISGLAIGFELVSETWTDGTRALGQGRSGASRRVGGPQNGKRKEERIGRRRRGGHANRCRPPSTKDHRS